MCHREVSDFVAKVVYFRVGQPRVRLGAGVGSVQPSVGGLEVGRELRVDDVSRVELVARAGANDREVCGGKGERDVFDISITPLRAAALVGPCHPPSR